MKEKKKLKRLIMDTNIANTYPKQMPRALDPCGLFLDRIEDLLRVCSRSRKVALDYKTRKLIEYRFRVKVREGANHQAHVCIIYDRRSCISAGINSLKSHAEVDALKKLLAIRPDTSNRNMYGMMVVRFSKTGVLNNSRPCLHCSRFLRKNLRFFHSISFSDVNGVLRVMTTDMFKSQEFSHVSRGKHRSLQCC